MKNYLIIVGLIVFIFASCNKECQVSGPPPYPEAFTFVIMEENKNLIDSAEIPKIYYLENNKKVYINDLKKVDLDAACTFRHALTSTDIAYKSADGIKNFYVEYNADTVENLLLDVEHIVMPATKENCGYHTYTYKKVAFNEKEETLSNESACQIYVFEK